MTLAFISIFVSTWLGATAALLMKKHSHNLDFRLLKTPVFFLKKNLFLALPAVLYFISTILFIPWLKDYPVGFLYSFTSLSYVWAVLLDKYVLKQRIYFTKAFGVALIIFGIVFVYLS